MTDIREMIENYLDNVDASYIIDLHNNTLGGDTIVTRDDFDDYFDGTGYLDVIDRLDGSFDASDDYFMDSYVIMSSCTLDDFIVFEMVIDYLKDTLEMADDRSDMPEGFESLYDEYKKEFKKPTQEEIKNKLLEVVCDLPESFLNDLACRTDSLVNMKASTDFLKVVGDWELPKLIGTLANSIGWFDPKKPYFMVTEDNHIQSYSYSDIRTEVWKALCNHDIDERWLIDAGYDMLVEVAHGDWE